MKNWSLTRLALVLFLFATAQQIHAQTDSLPDSKGRDFWFCFMPNFHNSFNSGSLGIDDLDVQTRDSLYIFVAADQPTNVHLEYRDSVGNLRVRDFRISDPTKMLSIGEQFYPYELMGFNRCGPALDLEGGQNLTIAKQSFHLTSDASDVTVYAMNQAVTTSDAFLVLPTDALGNQYYVMSYTADPFNSSIGSTPSQFAIVATEDSTVIQIEVSAPVFRYGVPPSRILLNKGDAYLVQSQIGDDFRKIDLTGTRVTSNRPIAVFGGHQRATIPIEDQSRSSRDCLIEEMTPISTWGHGALLVPYPEPADAILFSGDKYRILAAYDSTVVYIDSTFVTTLDAGQYYEADLLRPHVLFATRAVMVAQYKHTSATSGVGGGNNHLGDPFMMMIPPSNQFLKSYRFVNVQAWTPNQNGQPAITYEEQYLTVVLPTTSIPKLKVDGALPVAKFNVIPKSSFSYAHIPMQDGVHTVEADTGVGIYVYGYGIANSYGYVGGMAYKRYDFNAPQAFAKVDCYQLKGASYDTALADSRIVSMKLIKDSTINANVSIETFIPPHDSVHFSASLIDQLQDGSFKVEIKDVEGYVTRQRFDIPGYTLRLADTLGVLRVIEDNTLKPAFKRTYCRDYSYVNVGRFAHKVNSMLSSAPPGRYTISGNFPITIKPGDTLKFSVCYLFDVEGYFKDTIFVDLGCNPRPLITFDVEAGQDTSAPSITKIEEPCRSARRIELKDVGRFQTGIRNIKIQQSVNCSVALNFGVDVSVLDIVIKDWRLDAWYSLTVDDSVGNALSLGDTIEGFTVMYTNIDSLSRSLRITDKSYKISQCDSIELYNFGMFPKAFSALPLTQNVRFSFPQHQLPLTLMPGEKKKIAVCYYPDSYPIAEDSLWRDTLMLSFACHTRDLEFSAGVRPTFLFGISRCDVPFTTTSTRLLPSQLQSLNPSPASDELRVVIVSAQSGEATLMAVDQFGSSEQLFHGSLSEGAEVIHLDVSFLRSGLYSIVLVRDNCREFLPQLIVH